MIAAILRAQWLSMRIGAARGFIFRLITGVIWYGLWALIAVWLGMMASDADRPTLSRAAPLAFLAICGYWQLVPILSASLGSSLDMRKLLVYPAPHGKLFLVEVLLRLTTGMEMLMVFIAGLIGLAINPMAGGLAALPRLVAPGVLFVLFNLLLASGLRSVLERLLTRRHVRELLAVVMMSIWMLPRLVMATNIRPKSLSGLERVLEAVGLPWSAAARAALGESVVPALLSLAGWTLAAGWFGRRQFERNLRYDSLAAQATPLRSGVSRWQSVMERFYRLPSVLWRDPLAAIVEKELRSLARTPRFRMIFVMGFSFGLMLWLPMVMRRGVSRPGAFSEHFLTIVSVYALTLLGQVTYWNCFGFDRSAAAVYFASPAPISRALVGKNIAHLIYVYLDVAVLCAVTLLLPLHVGHGRVLETMLVTGVCSLYMLAMGNLSSVHYPRGLNPDRVSQGGASGRFQALIFLLYPLALLPVFLAYLARYAFDSEPVFYVALAVAAGFGAALYWMAIQSAVEAAGRRRESILQELSKGDGPVVSE
jgi:ABC-2 type transport system permease protein